MLKTTAFFILLLSILPTALAEQPLKVLQSYDTQSGSDCHYDLLIALPEGVSKEDLLLSSARVETTQWSYTTHEYEKLTNQGTLSYRAALQGATVSFVLPASGSCYLPYEAKIVIESNAETFSSSGISTSNSYCGGEDRSGESLWTCKELEAIQYKQRQKEREAEKAENADIRDAGERYTARLTGEVALRHPSLLGIKTADTLGKLGLRYEPIGFFTLGLTERLDLGLGVRSYRAGEEKLFFPGAEAKLKIVNEGELLPAISISASGNTLTKDRALSQGNGGLRLGSSSLGSFSDEAQHVGDTQFTLGLHGSKELGVLQGAAGKPHARLHMGALYTKTTATKGVESGAQSYTGDDLILQAGVDFTESHNVLALLAEGSYSLASQRTDIGAGFRASLGGFAADVGVGFASAESRVVDGSLIELPARFYPRIGFSFLF
jgi:hypothetical protein